MQNAAKSMDIEMTNPLAYKALVAEESRKNKAFKYLAVAMALVVLLILGAIVLSLLTGAVPVAKEFGIGFLFSKEWDPVQHIYGALPAIYGTLVTSAIALLLALPISLGIAVFLTELCPIKLRGPIGTAIELLAGIPSIIYGMWGLFILAPFLSEHVQPAMTEWFGDLWLIGPLFQGPPIGIGIMPASIVLAIMIIPFISSVMRDVFTVVPATLKESAYGLGATTSEVVWDIVLPYTRVGVVGAVMLGLGRALGETMAVTFMIGNANEINLSLFESGNSIASLLANEFAEAANPLHISSLITLGLILFVITFIVLAAARVMIAKAEKKEGVR
ncbi:phosphate ABC transporter permease subunit PstC [Leeia sp. TBRC 13508]|uniref:Phosphate transport system permease protein n=1 Tax=Leeia speluncae TaxID=2884804 RepID=A0ABS8D255_9NEIS|nr:phosphate ABC transporter permease subunit PstC [Leeia speluncae]MCB6182270.1 phosphate ABC transporter permease subunit PstC [Leeia speluncae]